MTVESVTVASDLNTSYPAAGDDLSEGDDHIRNIKTAVKAEAVVSRAIVPFVSSQTASTSSEINFTSFTAGYDYWVVADGVYLSSAGANLNARLYNAGVIDTGSVYETYGISLVSTTVANYSLAGPASSFLVGASWTATSTERGSFTFEIINPDGTTNAKMCHSDARYIQNASAPALYMGSCFYRATNAVNGVRFYPSSGNITAGTFTLYRRKRS